MSDIKDMLERVQQRGVAVVARAPVYNIYGRGAYNMAPIIKPTVWLTPEYFAAWLVEQQVCRTTVGYLSFGPMAQCVVHALKGLACRARVTPASSALTSPSLQACG